MSEAGLLRYSAKKNREFPIPSDGDREAPETSRKELTGINDARDRDAPGQNCVYIMSGNHWEEQYRLATYYHYPENAPVKPGDLAAAGMYFTGFRDRVKCFSCGMVADNLINGDDGMDWHWHKTDCPLIYGIERGNVALPESEFRSLLKQYKINRTSNQNSVASSSRDATDVAMSRLMRKLVLTETKPIYPKLTLASIVIPSHAECLRKANLKSEFERRKTYDKWPSYPAPYLISDLAKEGFFYLGNLDRCQCFSCSGVLRNWVPSDQVREQHQKHFPQCRIVLGLDAGNIAMNEAVRRQADNEYNGKIGQLINSTCDEPPDPSAEEQRRLSRYFPCLNAINPHMQLVQRRIATFDHRWPKTRIRATVEQIAKAGFYFMGEYDKTKCFYCDGVLHNWNPNYEPWTEHAKFFPECEYVLRQKGADFVRRLAEAHPNLNRPAIHNPVSGYDIPSSEERFSPQQSSETLSTSNTLVAIDLDLVTNDFGFTKEMTERAVERRASEGGVFADTSELVQYLLDHGDELLNGVPAQQEPRKNVESMTSLPARSSDTPMAESLREPDGMCKNCRNKKVEMVMVPCGHLSLCEICAQSAKRCIICNVRIEKTIKALSMKQNK